MKKILIVLLLAVFAVLSCSEDEKSSVYQGSGNDRPDPIGTSISAQVNPFYAALDEVIIEGQNFSPVAAENRVLFNGVPGVVTTSSATMIKAKSPAETVGDSIRIHVNVKNAANYAKFGDDFFTYFNISSVTSLFGGFDKIDKIFASDFDSDGNMYVSLAEDNKGNVKVIQKITPDGVATVFGKTSFTKASGLKVGPSGALFYVNLLPYIFTLEQEGAKDKLYAPVPGPVNDLDFAPDGRIYCAGGGEAIYMVNTDKSSSTVATYDGFSINTIRVFNGYVYVAASKTGNEQQAAEEAIYRNKINTDGTLGVNELYYDWNKNYALYDVNSFTFSADGILYIGTNAPGSIIVVQLDGSDAVLYPGILDYKAFTLTWGTGNYLYLNSKDAENPEATAMVKIDMRKAGAPYNGRNL